MQNTSTKEPLSVPVWLLLLIFLAVATAAAGFFLAPASTTTATGASPPGTERSISQDGIDATLESVVRANGQTILTLSLNNHQDDLSNPAIASRSTLGGVTASQWRAPKDANGHHARGELIFEGEIGGTLRLGATENVTLVFEGI